MSVYDFNHNDQYQSSAHGSHETSNGTHAPRFQTEGDYMNKNCSSNQPEMSVQLARPTSKIAMLVRQRRAMLEQLSCFICRGYLIDATTIDECMDSFCKSCIVTYLRTHSNCPKCNISISRLNPLNAIHSDKVLQDIVYKLVPGLFDDEMKRRREFYRRINGGPSSSEDDEEVSSSSSNSGLDGSCMNNEQHGIVSHPKPFYKPSDDIDLSIEPQARPESSVIYYDNKRQSIVTCFTGAAQNQQQERKQQQMVSSLFSLVDSKQFKTYLRCPAKFTVLQLKKFITAKFNICRDATVHLLYLNESLKDEYSLIDIAYIYDWRGLEHMRFFYVIERDVSTIDDRMESHIYTNYVNQASKTRQGTAENRETQTVKRVCIDPQPKFYEERQGIKNVNTNGLTNRLTRSKTEMCTGTNRSVVTQATTTVRTPILRSSGTSQEGSTYERVSRQASNGLATRETATSSNQRASLVQSPYRSVSTATRELSHLKQEPPKDTRAFRETAGDSGFTSNHVHTNLSSQAGVERNNITYSKTAISKDAPRGQSSESTAGSHQLVPYINRKNTQSTNTGTLNPQSSIVTLASFSDTRNNHIISLSKASTATTISGSYKNILSAGISYKPGDGKSDSSKNKPATRNDSGSNPPPVFSIVTERGITIVRRPQNQTDVTTSTTTTTTSMPINSSNNLIKLAMGSVPAIMAVSSRSQQQQAGMSSSRGNSSPASQQQANSGGVPSQSQGLNASSSTSGNEGQSSRHLIKAKPVYKTLVDPTKVKSPNFKKFGYTARH